MAIWLVRDIAPVSKATNPHRIYDLVPSQKEVKTMTATSKPQRKSKQAGVGSELSVFFKVKPGQGSILRQQLAKWDVSVSRSEALKKTTLSDTRFVVFD